jgi:hypothetical protein
MAKKYVPLADHLRRQSGPRHTMSFAEIEDLVGILPPSAHSWRAWWANDRSHVEAKDGWLAVGWEVESVDQPRETVTFRR